MRRHRASGILVIGVLCGAAALGTAEAHGKLLRSTRLVTGGTSWRGTLWEAERPGIPYDVNLVLATGQERIGGARHSSPTRSRRGRASTCLSGAYWAAYRVG